MSSSAVYRVRITVVNLAQTPVDDAKVWSSFGGEPKKVSGGWEMNIPAATKPAAGKLTVFAEQPSAFLAGREDVELGAEYNPAVTVRLQHNRTARVRGLVQDERGRALEKARVMVVGHGDEMVVTSASGDFVLAAHAAVGQQVLLHAERDGYETLDLWHPAGEHPAVLVLRTKRR
jgi:hypothetical protein